MAEAHRVDLTRTPKHVDDPGNVPTREHEAVDFDLHGLVSVRLLGAHARDVEAVARQLGPIRGTPAGEPDIHIRFVDHIPLDSPLHLLGAHEAGFTEDAFLVLRAKHKARARVRIPLEQVGGRCEIVCEHGVPAVPLLIAIVNLTALAKGTVPLHAAAFEWRGAGVIATGWSKGGKTETLLSFVERGARYIADEWCYLAPDGRIFGVPEPVTLWHWHLRQLPEFRRRLPRAARLRLASLAALPAFEAGLPARLRRTAFGRATQRLARFVEGRLKVNVPPERLFRQPVRAAKGTLRHLLFMVSAEDAATRVSPIAPEEVAERMVHSLQYERGPLLDHYAMFRFAFPERSNPHLEQAEARQRDLLRRAFSGRTAHRVVHPYPVEIAKLFEAIEPLLR